MVAVEQISRRLGSCSVAGASSQVFAGPSTRPALVSVSSRFPAAITNCRSMQYCRERAAEVVKTEWTARGKTLLEPYTSRVCSKIT